MALVNTDGIYIKLTEYGDYIEYGSIEAREKVKKATSSEVILSKYNELIAYYRQQEDWENYNLIRGEYMIYYADYIDRKGSRNEYPIMSQTFPDIKDSLAEIIESGCLFINENNIHKVYETVKIKQTFGETIDV